jgi:hypothetical protein
MTLMAGTRNQRHGTPGMRFPKTAVPVIGRGLRPLLTLLFLAVCAACGQFTVPRWHHTRRGAGWPGSAGSSSICRWSCCTSRWDSCWSLCSWSSWPLICVAPGAGENPYAIRAGVALALVGTVLITSGLMLVRFDFLAVQHPAAREVFYWLHVIAPLAGIWLFLLHRLAGPPLRWRHARPMGVAGRGAGCGDRHPASVPISSDSRAPPASRSNRPSLGWPARVIAGRLAPERLMRDSFLCRMSRRHRGTARHQHASSQLLQ